jgi:SM-20-related protein
VALRANDKHYNNPMISQYFAYNLEELLRKITEHGFCVMDNFITPDTTLELANEITALNNDASMRTAGTGQTLVTVDRQLRGDSIYWLNEVDASAAQRMYFKKMEELRLMLNQHLFLGIFALESHMAFYPIGTSYKKHIDRFRVSQIKSNDRAVRQISCILYLNQEWLEKDGGHLRLYSNTGDETTHLDISPIGGRLVMFLSDTFYHEVLPATRIRMSLTAWFLTRQ